MLLEVCSQVGLVVVDGRFECSPLSVASVTTTARQIVSKRWWEGGGLKHLHVGERSAFRLYQKMANFKAAMESRAMQWSAMPEENSKRINLRKHSFAS
jgi:hypothetical protein